MAGTLIADYVQASANTLTFQNSIGQTIFSSNTTGFYSSSGVLVIPASGITNYVANTVTSNTITSNTGVGTIGTLTYASTITPDFSLYNNYTVTLTGNATLANAINTIPGQSGVIFIQQDSTGSRTLSYGSMWKFINATAPTLSTSANSTDILAYTVQTAGRIDASLLTNFN